MTVWQLPDPSVLTPIESVSWTPGGELPEAEGMVVRGSPISAEKLWVHALLQARENSFGGTNILSVSADIVVRPERELARD